MIGNHVVTAIGGVIMAACSVIPGCEPTPTTQPDCIGDVITVYGFDTPTGCNLTPPQELRVFDEHPAPWSPSEADTFYYWCGEYDGVVVDAEGDAWICGEMSY